MLNAFHTVATKGILGSPVYKRALTHSGALGLLAGLNARAKFSSENRRFNAFIYSFCMHVSVFNIEYIVGIARIALEM